MWSIKEILVFFIAVFGDKSLNMYKVSKAIILLPIHTRHRFISLNNIFILRSGFLSQLWTLNTSAGLNW